MFLLQIEIESAAIAYSLFRSQRMTAVRLFFANNITSRVNDTLQQRRRIGFVIRLAIYCFCR